MHLTTVAAAQPSADSDVEV